MTDGPPEPSPDASSCGPALSRDIQARFGVGSVAQIIQSNVVEHRQLLKAAGGDKSLVARVEQSRLDEASRQDARLAAMYRELAEEERAAEAAARGEQPSLPQSSATMKKEGSEGPPSSSTGDAVPELRKRARASSPLPDCRAALALDSPSLEAPVAPAMQSNAVPPSVSALAFDFDWHGLGNLGRQSLLASLIPLWGSKWGVAVGLSESREPRRSDAPLAAVHHLGAASSVAALTFRHAVRAALLGTPHAYHFRTMLRVLAAPGASAAVDRTCSSNSGAYLPWVSLEVTAAPASSVLSSLSSEPFPWPIDVRPCLFPTQLPVLAALHQSTVLTASGGVSRLKSAPMSAAAASSQQSSLSGSQLRRTSGSRGRSLGEALDASAAANAAASLADTLASYCPAHVWGELRNALGATGDIPRVPPAGDPLAEACRVTSTALGCVVGLPFGTAKFGAALAFQTHSNVDRCAPPFDVESCGDEWDLLEEPGEPTECDGGAEPASALPNHIPVADFFRALHACGAVLPKDWVEEEGDAPSAAFSPTLNSEVPPAMQLLRRVEALRVACDAMGASVGVHAVSLHPPPPALEAQLRALISPTPGSGSPMHVPIVSPCQRGRLLEEAGAINGGPLYLYPTCDLVRLAAQAACMLADATVAWRRGGGNVGGLRLQRPPLQSPPPGAGEPAVAVAGTEDDDPGIADLDEDLHEPPGSQAASADALIAAAAAPTRASILQLLATLCDALAWRERAEEALSKAAALKEETASDHPAAAAAAAGVATARSKRKALPRSHASPDDGIIDAPWVLDVVELIMQRFLPAALLPLPAQAERDAANPGAAAPMRWLKTATGRISIPASVGRSAVEGGTSMGEFLHVRCGSASGFNAAASLFDLSARSPDLFSEPARRARRRRY